MIKKHFNLIIGGALCFGLATACNSKPKEPEITQMEAKQDSLKQVEKTVNEDIDKVQQSLKEVDKEFPTN